MVVSPKQLQLLLVIPILVLIIILSRYKPIEGAEEKKWTEIGSIPSDLTEYILKDMTPGQQFIIQVNIII